MFNPLPETDGERGPVFRTRDRSRAHRNVLTPASPLDGRGATARLYSPTRTFTSRPPKP